MFNDNSRIYELLEKYSKGEEHLGKRLIELQDKINKADIIVPFLGTQGAGKSTLINALLGEDLLPNEADETTCIPVEVRYDDTTSVQVFFKDGQQQEIGIDQNSIAEFVDNRFNPGNEKGVDRIVIRKELGILKCGLILVDLPGVGSLTHANEETTTKYIQNLSAAVFLFSTTPPILKKEAAFIKNIWRGINNAYFVQNVWDDNSDSEKEDGLNHNRKILSDIAREINASFHGTIIPVNAYAAAYGKFRNEEEKVKGSNITVLENELKDFAINFKDATKKAFEQRTSEAVGYIKASLEDSIRQSSMSYEDIIDEMNKKKRLFEDKHDEIKSIARRIDDRIYEEKKQVKTYAKMLAEKKTNRLRVEMYALIDKGLVDGKKLDSAFSQYQADHEEEVCNEVYDKLSLFTKNLSEDYDKLDAELDEIERLDEGKEKLGIKKKIKFEKAAAFALKMGGGVAGVVIGGCVAGPVGMALVGMTVGLFGTGVSIIFEKGINRLRGIETKKLLNSALDVYQEKIERYVSIYCNRYIDSIKGNVDMYLNSMKEQLAQISEEISKFRREGQNLKFSEDEMRSDLDYLRGLGI